MKLIYRLRHAIGKRWYSLLPTDRLIALIGDQNNSRNGRILLESLKERLAHQDGSLDQLDWSAANLGGALLSSCRMKQAKFSSAMLRGAYFGYSDLRGADFSRADLRETHFREARLDHARFDGADLRGANFARAVLAGSSFVKADLTEVNFWRADLRGANLRDALMCQCGVADAVIDDSTTLPHGACCVGSVHGDGAVSSGRV
ncbi:MAG: pentapeptide repeat-containing protein [Chloroflexi bacterium]|nr:pentapeptide repeat-containing protein [Chloroflexota bacterium]